MDKKGILRDTDDKGEDTRVDIEEAEAGSPSSLRREVSMEPIEIEEETAETAGSYRSLDEEETLGEHQPNHKANGIADGDNDIRETKSSPKRFAGKKETIALRPLTMPKRGKPDDEKESLIETGSPKIVIERTIFTQKTFDDQFEPGRRPTSTIQERTKRKISKYSCSPRCCKNFLFTIFPIMGVFKKYSIRQDLMGDLIAGLTVGIMHLPQGMAYGMLTTLPPVYGLYMSFFPVLVYFMFGSSKHLSIGSFAVACLMVGASVDKHYTGFMSHSDGPHSNTTDNNTYIATTASYETGTGNSSWLTGTQFMAGSPTASPSSDSKDAAMSPEEIQARLEIVVSLTFIVGFIQKDVVYKTLPHGYFGSLSSSDCTTLSSNTFELFMGFSRLGFVTVYLSDPLIAGFTTGAACHVFTSQIKHVFGVKTERYSGPFKLIYTYSDFFSGLPYSNPVTLIFSIVCMALLYGVSRFINQNPKLKPKMFMPVPIELIVVVLGTIVSHFGQFNEKFKVKIVDTIPTGLPAPTPPFKHLGVSVIMDAVFLSVVVFAISISMAKLLAKKHDYEVNPNQELVAYGLSNMVSAFFASPTSSASMSRSLVGERVGGKTQIAGLVSCSLILVVLLAIGPYFRTLPNAVLASIIIIALRGMFLQILDLPKLWNVSVIDFSVWVVSFLATVLLDVDLGLAVAVIYSIITVVARSQRPYACLLGKIPGTDIYTDINVYKEASEVEGVKIFRFEYSLFFVNTEHFRSNLYKLTLNPRTLKIIQKKREKRLSKRLSTNGFKTDASGGMELEIPTPGTPSTELQINVISTHVENPPDCNFHTIILDCSSWGFVDTMGVKVLISTIAEYKAIGVRVFLAKCKAGIREMFEKTRFYESVDRHNVYITVHDAVQHSMIVESPLFEKPAPFSQ